MRRNRAMFRLSALFCLLLAAAPLAAADRQLTGEVPGGGRFQIALPEGWAAGDALILYQRGFTLRSDVVTEDPQLAPDDALLQAWLERGYAVAAGSYAQRGWAVFDGGAHQRAVLERFVAEAGQPGRIVLVGGSLGGLLSVKTAEQLVAAGQPVHGVYALCPAFAGARTWDRAADLKLAYDAVCAGVGGGEIDRGSSDPAWIPDFVQVPADWGNEADPEVQRLAARLMQCTGAFLPDWARNSGQRQRLATLGQAFGISDMDFFINNMAYASFALSDLVRGPDKLRGASPFDNRFVSYGDAALDASVERVQADVFARAELSVLSDPTWEIGDARLLALHTSRDELVVPEHLSLLQPLAAASPAIATALVEEDAPSHCGFSDSEFVAGFLALERWMDGAAEPTPASLNAGCEALAGELAGGDTRCRFADASQLDAYATRVPDRGLPQHAPVAAASSGAWFDPATDGEGFFVQVLPGGSAAVSWYTYAADGSGAPHWIVGQGLVRGNALLVQQAFSVRGGGFGQDFDPGTLDQQPWGRLTFVLEEPLPGSTLRRGRVRYEGPQGWGTGERWLQQITHDGCGGRAGCAPAGLALHGYSGLWFRGPEQAGDGLFFQVDAGGQALLAWYLFTPQGEPLWLTGVAPAGADTDAVRFTLFQAHGARFGADFDPAEVVRRRWGEATLRFDGCDRATLAWEAEAPGYPDGALALQRLTPAPAGSACAP